MMKRIFNTEVHEYTRQRVLRGKMGVRFVFSDQKIAHEISITYYNICI